MSSSSTPQTEDKASKRETILEAARKVEALPAAVTEALAIVQDPNSSMTDLARSIEFDPGLTSNVLRLANSAYFGGGNISSLRDALVRLGQRKLFQVLLTSSLAPLAGKPLRGYSLPAGHLLAQSIAVAIGTECLPVALGRPVPGFAFTAGLLHDVGKIVMGSFLELDAKPVLQYAEAKGVPFDEAEREILGIDHAETGAALLNSWRLPSEIVDAVRWHHQPEAYPGEDPFVTDLVHVADLLTIECGIGTGVDGLNYRPSQAAITRLNVNQQAAEQVLCEMQTGLTALCRALNINLGS